MTTDEYFELLEEQHNHDVVMTHHRERKARKMKATHNQAVEMIEDLMAGRDTYVLTSHIA